MGSIKSSIGQCWDGKKAYVKINLMGALASTFTWAIFQFLETIQDYTKLSGYQGVSCWNNKDLPLPGQSCYAIDINNTVGNGSYAPVYYEYFGDDSCSASEAASSILAFIIFTNTVIAATVIFGVSTICHDCIVLYHRKTLDSIDFYPRNYQKTHYLTGFVESRKFLSGSPLCFTVIRTITNIFDIIMNILFIWPIVDYLCCARGRGWSCCKFENINKFTKLAPIWVGLSRGIIIGACILLIWRTADGFEYLIDSPIPESCYCWCKFTLHTGGLLGYIGVAGTLVLANLIALSSWINEAIYGKYYLYLISYTLPIEVAYERNPKDPTGTMLIIDQDGNQEDGNHPGPDTPDSPDTPNLEMTPERNMNNTNWNNDKNGLFVDENLEMTKISNKVSEDRANTAIDLKVEDENKQESKFALISGDVFDCILRIVMFFLSLYFVIGMVIWCMIDFLWWHRIKGIYGWTGNSSEIIMISILGVFSCIAIFIAWLILSCKVKRHYVNKWEKARRNTVIN